jgi:4-hydroxy-tetrahydrodipicolinate reductase
MVGWEGLVAQREGGIPVVVAGLGDMGLRITRSVLETPELRLAGAVDPALSGRKLASVLNGTCPDITVADDAARAFHGARGGVLLQATASTFEAVRPQIEEAVKAGLAVASTCEELAYPWLKHEAAAEALDRLAERNEVSVVGTGVNPGFALDRLPAVLAQVAGPVRHVEGTRVVDAAQRRRGLRRKIGAGLGEEAWELALDRGEVGHVGLPESAALAALGCGLEVDEVDEEIDAVLAERDHRSPPIREGDVAGIHHRVRGYSDGREVVRLDLIIAVGAEDPRDEVRLEADPPLHLSVPGGIPGEEATVWAMVHAAEALPQLRGLITVLDLPAGR